MDEPKEFDTSWHLSVVIEQIKAKINVEKIEDKFFVKFCQRAIFKAY